MFYDVFNSSLILPLTTLVPRRNVCMETFSCSFFKQYGEKVVYGHEHTTRLSIQVKVSYVDMHCSFIYRNLLQINHLGLFYHTSRMNGSVEMWESTSSCSRDSHAP